MKVNKLDKRFTAKYNKLYYEVAKYYGLTSFIKQSNVPSRKDINYIVITDLGIIPQGVLKQHYSTADISKLLNIKYPYLLPFYKLYHHICDSDNFDKSIFNEINNSIKTIRNKNETI